MAFRRNNRKTFFFLNEYFYGDDNESKLEKEIE